MNNRQKAGTKKNHYHQHIYSSAFTSVSSGFVWCHNRVFMLNIRRSSQNMKSYYHRHHQHPGRVTWEKVHLTPNPAHSPDQNWFSKNRNINLNTSEWLSLFDHSKHSNSRAKYFCKTERFRTIPFGARKPHRLPPSCQASQESCTSAAQRPQHNSSWFKSISPRWVSVSSILLLRSDGKFVHCAPFTLSYGFCAVYFRFPVYHKQLQLATSEWCVRQLLVHLQFTQLSGQ